MTWDQIMFSVTKYWDVDLEEWLSAGWWERGSDGYSTLLGLWTHQQLLIEGVDMNETQKLSERFQAAVAEYGTLPVDVRVQDMIDRGVVDSKGKVILGQKKKPTRKKKGKAKMIEKLKQIREMQAEVQKKIREIGQDGMREVFAEVFAQHPDLEAVRWRQYTPYFNDGEACTFSVNDAYIKFKGYPKDSEDEDCGDYEDGFDYYSSYRSEDYPVGFGKAYEAVQEVFRIADDDIFLAIFGDHVAVTVSRAGIKVDEYDHD
jgi:hypothetical protein